MACNWHTAKHWHVWTLCMHCALYTVVFTVVVLQIMLSPVKKMNCQMLSSSSTNEDDLLAHRHMKLRQMWKGDGGHTALCRKGSRLVSVTDWWKNWSWIFPPLQAVRCYKCDWCCVPDSDTLLAMPVFWSPWTYWLISDYHMLLAPVCFRLDSPHEHVTKEAMTSGILFGTSVMPSSYARSAIVRDLICLQNMIPAFHHGLCAKAVQFT